MKTIVINLNSDWELRSIGDKLTDKVESYLDKEDYDIIKSGTADKYPEGCLCIEIDGIGSFEYHHEHKRWFKEVKTKEHKDRLKQEKISDKVQMVYFGNNMPSPPFENFFLVKFNGKYSWDRVIIPAIKKLVNLYVHKDRSRNTGKLVAGHWNLDYMSLEDYNKAGKHWRFEFDGKEFNQVPFDQ